MHIVQGTETGKHRYKEPVIGYTRGRKVVYSMIGFLIALLSGALMSIQGAFITYTVIQSMDALGPARAVMLIVVAQLAVAYGIELLGWFGVEKQPWEWRKALGMGIAIVGIVIFKWR